MRQDGDYLVIHVHGDVDTLEAISEKIVDDIVHQCSCGGDPSHDCDIDVVAMWWESGDD